MLRNMMTPMLRFSRPLARQLLVRQSPVASFIRHAATSPKGFRPSPGFIVFSEQLEQEIRHRLDALPSSGKIFQNPDGTARNPNDEELQEVAALSILAQKSRLSSVDFFRLTEEQTQLYIDNQTDLKEYLDGGRRILDKIPVEDPITGQVTWTIIRERQKEGWEPIIYYFFIPSLLIALTFALFLDKENISDWALEELRIRAQEKYEDSRQEFAKENNISPEEVKKRDALIVERILSGEYDRLAGLKKAGSELPTSLI